MVWGLKGWTSVEHSLFAAQLWDLRASLERQLRCLTTIQQAHGAFRRSADQTERHDIKGNIVRDLNDIRDISNAVSSTLADALRQADVELSI